MGRLTFGIDLGGTNIQLGLVDETGKVLHRKKAKTRAADGLDAVMKRIAEKVTDTCEEAKVKLDDLLGIGIGAPGAIDPVEGIVHDAPNLGWQGVDVPKELSKLLGVKVTLDNDVNVAVYGEWKFGAGRGTDDLLGVWCGTGVGGGLILAGKLYYGGFLTAGEIGHMVLFPEAPPVQRSVEQNCSRTAIVDQFTRMMRSSRPTMLHELTGSNPSKLKSSVIGKAYTSGDEMTCEVVDHAAMLLGTRVGSLVTLLSLPRIVMGGGLTEAVGKPFVDKVREHVHQTAFPERCKAVEVVMTSLEDDAGVIGAGMLARERFS